MRRTRERAGVHRALATAEPARAVRSDPTTRRQQHGGHKPPTLLRPYGTCLCCHLAGIVTGSLRKTAEKNYSAGQTPLSRATEFLKPQLTRPYAGHRTDVITIK